MVEVDEVSHLLGHLAPLLGEFHHVLAALVVVVLGRDVFRRLLVVDILLRDAQLLLHTELHGQSVGVPAGLAVHLEAAHRLIAVESVLDGTRKDVVDAGVSVGRGWSLEENKLRMPLTLVYTLVEDVFLLPLLKNVSVHLCKVEPFVFGEFLSHRYIYLSVFSFLYYIFIRLQNYQKKMFPPKNHVKFGSSARICYFCSTKGQRRHRMAAAVRGDYGSANQ